MKSAEIEEALLIMGDTPEELLQGGEVRGPAGLRIDPYLSQYIRGDLHCQSRRLELPHPGAGLQLCCLLAQPALDGGQLIDQTGLQLASPWPAQAREQVVKVGRGLRGLGPVPGIVDHPGNSARVADTSAAHIFEDDRSGLDASEEPTPDPSAGQPFLARAEHHVGIGATNHQADLG
jgi:hypothetical protein